MSFARQAITGLMRAAGKGSWVTDRVAGVASHCVSSPWWAGGLVAEAEVALPRGAGRWFWQGAGGGLELLCLRIVIGSPSLLELGLDEIFL